MSNMDSYQQFIATSRYARWLPEENRRESWEETVSRYIDFFKEQVAERISWAESAEMDWDALYEAIRDLEVMPSMRALMSAGRALERDNVAGFNCSYLPIDHPRAFDEMMYILMCGTGVGFSVERQSINQLPEIADEMRESDTVISVPDSRKGWASSLRQLISLLYGGTIPKWDLSKLRPAGARLITTGGRSSGPKPLDELFHFVVEKFTAAAGRKLTSIECHDICCKIGDVVVVGGVRRSALISLSNLTDDRMRRAKSGQWWVDDPQRALANNSACYTERPDVESFLKEWSSLYESKSGERGVFSRTASQKQAARNGRRDSSYDFGTNPCSEIILRPYQFCNLSEVVVRATDTLEDLTRKVRIAAILGTLQATLTDFKYLRPVWKRNTEEEALLGVSLTGIMDHPVLNGSIDAHSPDWCFGENLSLPQILETLKGEVIETNKQWAERLGINPATAATAVKPSGTVSQLVDSASGIHPRFAPYYIRRVRGDRKDPLTAFLEAEGVPTEQDVMNASGAVFSFPKLSPEGAVHTSDMGAMEQLRLWKIYQDHWCEHKPSITVYYKEEEFMQIGAWLYENFDDVSGISFLPYSDHTYRQAPYEEINKETYEQLLADMPEIDWDKLGEYEKEDTTKGTQELSCVAGYCEIVDV